MSAFQSATIKVDGQIIQKPDPKVRKKPKRNRGRRSSLLTCITAINGIGLPDTSTPEGLIKVSLLNRIAGKRCGVHYPKLTSTLGPEALAIIELIRVHPFRNPDTVSADPDLRQEKDRSRGKIGKDYSGYPSQKRSKASYKLAKGRRRTPATPRQCPWVVPEKYATLEVAETPLNATEAPVRFKLKA